MTSRHLSLLICMLLGCACRDALADEYASPYGEWRGQTQYQATIKGESDAGAHAVIPLILEIERGGKVTGASPDNGCRVLGIAKPGISPNIVTLNVTLTGCAYA